MGPAGYRNQCQFSINLLKPGKVRAYVSMF
jgi:hypothetical protein